MNLMVKRRKHACAMLRFATIRYDTWLVESRLNVRLWDVNAHYAWMIYVILHFFSDKRPWRTHAAHSFYKFYFVTFYVCYSNNGRDCILKLLSQAEKGRVGICRTLRDYLTYLRKNQFWVRCQIRYWVHLRFEFRFTIWISIPSSNLWLGK